MPTPDKIWLLRTINQQPEDLIYQLLRSGDFTIQDLRDNKLSNDKLNRIEAKMISERTNFEAMQINEDRAREFCLAVRDGRVQPKEVNVALELESITEDHLIRYAGFTPELIQRVRDFIDLRIDFNRWKDLPPLVNDCTDVYFMGQVGSGKSCILASLFYYLHNKGISRANMVSPIGTRYHDELVLGLSKGMLPPSTPAISGEKPNGKERRDGVNFIHLELFNAAQKLVHPINFIEMSGEHFSDAYEGGVLGPVNRNGYLDNKNRKVLFFIVDYSRNQDYIEQSQRLAAVLSMMDDKGTLDQAEAIIVVITKSDLFPANVPSDDFAYQYLESSYTQLIRQLRDLRSAHNNSFELIYLPYSLGDFRFNMLVNRSDDSAKEMTELIFQYTVGKRPGNNLLQTIMGR